MLYELFHVAIYDPLYNGLVFILSVLPHADVGIAVVLLTILVKILLFPLARRAIHTQIALKKIGPDLERVKKEYATDQQEQVKKMFALYKENGIHPFSGFLIILIQIPIIFGLYLVFMRGGLPNIDTTLLYSFIPTPQEVSMLFLGFIDLSGKSIILALIAGVSQFFHARIAMQPPENLSKPGESMKDDIVRSLHIQMRYVLPVVITVVAYTISSAVALYWATSNIFTLLQELYVRRARNNT